MNTVNASVILEDAERLLGWDIDQLEPRQEQIARTALSLALQEIWESWWWEELMLAAAIAAATIYASTTTFAADAFVYFPGSQQFYQAMQATTGNDPAILNATDTTGQSWTPNYSYWAHATQAPCAGNYSATTIYNIGDRARSPVDGLVYQVIATAPGVAVSGAGVTSLNGNYEEIEGSYIQNGEFVIGSGAIVNHTPTLQDPANYWEIALAGVGACYQSAIGSFATPDLANPWVGIDNSSPPNPSAANNPPPTVTSALYTGIPSSTSSFWHVVNPFTPCVPVPGDARSFGHHDPRNHAGGLVPFEKTMNGYRLPGWTHGVPWAWYRRSTPILTGDPFDPTVAYTQAPVITFN